MKRGKRQLLGVGNLVQVKPRTHTYLNHNIDASLGGVYEGVLKGLIF